MKPSKGQIVRYASGVTALMRVIEEYSGCEDGWRGTHCLGGSHFALERNLREATQEDVELFVHKEIEQELYGKPKKSLDEVAGLSASIRESKGFHTPGSITGADGEAMLGKLMLVTTEVAEAAEAVRNEDIENFREELADIIIRTVDLAHSCGISIGRAVDEKMKRNATRAHRHGRKSRL